MDNETKAAYLAEKLKEIAEIVEDCVDEKNYDEAGFLITIYPNMQ